jgi:NADH-quinone oxidoreductase subunit N
MIPVPEINLGGVLPALILGVAGLLATLLGLFVRKGAATVGAIIGFTAVLIALAANAPLRFMNTPAFSGMIVLDTFSWFFNLLILLSVGLTILISMKYLTDQGLDLYEYFAILLFSSVGMMFMVSGTHLLMIFVGLETLSIGVYVLTGVLPKSSKASEASLKYLLLGSFSSGLFLYGAALLYGASGSLSLAGLAKYFQSGSINTMGLIGMGLLLVGFSFKVAAVPFHMWTPDVYDGAPSPITGFMSVGVKAAAFAAFLRVFFECFSSVQVTWSHILWILAVLTMILGNLAALVQSNIKRMLAYSSIAHAGYILIGMVAGTAMGAAGILYYLFA